GGAAPRPGRAGLGEDPRHHPPDRVPRRGTRRTTLVDSRRHVHEPGGARDDGALAVARTRPARAVERRNVSRLLREGPASRRRADRRRSLVYHRRRRRPGWSGQEGSPRSGPRREAEPAACLSFADLFGEEQDDWAGGVSARRRITP